MRAPLGRLLGLRLATLAAGDGVAALVAAGVAPSLLASTASRELGASLGPSWQLAPLLLLLLWLVGAYRLESLAPAWSTALRVAAALCIGGGALLGSALGLLEPATAPPAVAFAGCASLLVPLAPIFHRALSSRFGFEQLVLIIGSDDLAAAVARSFVRARPLGLRIAGHLSDESTNESKPDLGVCLGALSEFEKVIRAFVVHRVVSSPAARDAMDTDGLLAARLAWLPVDDATTWYEALEGRVWTGSITRQILLGGDGSRPGRSFRAAKRATDVVLSAVCLVLAVPLVALAACAIKLDSKGPVFYRQTRVGVDHRSFPLFKLRTMRQHAESDSGPVLTEWMDPRITRVGRFLRRSRIDEIPQLWNVLRGDMSIVGPRPERPEFVDRLNGDFELFRFRTAVRPGLTGWAQVHQGYVNEWHDFEGKLAYDLFYLKHRSVLMELSILRETFVELLLMKGM